MTGNMEGKGKMVMGARRALLHQLRGKIDGLNEAILIVDTYGEELINDEFLTDNVGYRRTLKIISTLMKRLHAKRKELCQLLEDGEKGLD